MIQAKFRGWIPCAHLPFMRLTTTPPQAVASGGRTVGATSWTRTIRTPWLSAHAAAATDASRRSSAGTGVTAVARRAAGPARAAAGRRRGRRTRRAAARGTTCATARRPPGSPVATSASRWPSSARLWLDRLAEPEARVDPHLVDAEGDGLVGPLDEEVAAPRPRRRRRPGATCIVRGSPCMCIATQPTPAPAATLAREAETSLTSVAPASMAASAVSAWRVSIETRTWGASSCDRRAGRGAAPRPGRPARRRAGSTRRPRRSTAAPSATSSEPVGDGGVVDRTSGRRRRRSQG